MEQQHQQGFEEPASTTQQQEQHPKQPSDQQQPSGNLNPTAARLLREAIISKPADGEKSAADVSSDILAFSRLVDRVDSTLD